MYTSKSKAISRLIIIIGIIILVNLLVFTFFFRLDFTADKRYTLSSTTKEILKNLDGPVTITAYFSEELPPDIKTLKDEFRDLLTEYSSYSDHKVRFVFIDPAKDKKLKEDLARKGILPLQLNIRKKDKFQQQEVFLGAYVQYKEQFEAIPAIQPGAPMEYALTFAIKKCSSSDKPAVALLQGHGEAGMQNLLYVNEALSALYTIVPYSLDDSLRPLSAFKTLIILNPVDSFRLEELAIMTDYFLNGGKIFISYSYVKGDLMQNPPQAYINATMLENWLEEFGLRLKPNLVYDANSAQITVQQKAGYYMQLQFPYIIFFNKFGKHPVTEGLENVLLPFASEIEILNTGKQIKVSPLIISSDQSGTSPAPMYFDVQRIWNDADFNRFNIPVAVAAEYGKAKLILVSNGDFALNDEQGRMQGTQDDLNFLANAVDWLSDESGLAELRTKTISARPLRQVSDRRKAIIKYTNVVLPLFIIVIFGVLRFRWNKIRVKKWLKM